MKGLINFQTTKILLTIQNNITKQPLNQPTINLISNIKKHPTKTKTLKIKKYLLQPTLFTHSIQ